MSNILTKSINKKLSRRTFLKASAAATTLAALGDKLLGGPVSTLVEGVAGAQVEDKWVPSTCGMCHMGRDLVRGHVVNGVLVNIEGNPEFKDKVPCPSMCCVKPRSWVQMTYNPYRLKGPMKRTNPLKGINEDPGFVEISWDEALDILANKLKEIRAKGVRNELGLPRVAKMEMTLSGNLGHGWGPFWSVFGPTDPLGIAKCYDREHRYGGAWSRVTTTTVDWKYANWALVFAKNLAHTTNHGLGANGFQFYADFKVRGGKHIQVGPHMNAMAAKADEWLPIKPGTDTAFLYAMLNVILHEMVWQDVCDIPYLKSMTNSPYLVGPNGNYARDPVSKKPLVWDSAAGAAKVFNDPTIGDFALEGGPYTIAAVEVDYNNVEIPVTEGTPSFQLLVAHLVGYNPLWASVETDIPAETIRRIAHEFVENSKPGGEFQTIEIDGVRLPYRPASIQMGKSVSNNIGAYQTVWAVHVLHMLMGSINVPGGSANGGHTTIDPAGGVWTAAQLEDGFPPRASGQNGWKGTFVWPPRSRRLAETIWVVGTQGLRYSDKRIAGEDFMGLPGSIPDAIVTRSFNKVISGMESNVTRRALERSPFFADVALTVTETNWYADLLLPDSTWSEGFQNEGDLKKWGCEYTGVSIRQPMVQPPVNARDITDFMTDLAIKMGPAFHTAFNRHSGIMGPTADASPRRYTVEEVMERLLRNATGGLYGLDYFKEHGAVMWPISPSTWYMHPLWVNTGARYMLPYQESLKKTHEKRLIELHGVGIFWADSQYEMMSHGLPPYINSRPIYEEVFEAGAGSEYDLWVHQHRSHMFAHARTRGVAWMEELNRQYIDGPGILINPETAASKGIQNGDWVAIESKFGRTTGEAIVSPLVRPDCVEVCDRTGTYRTPISKDQGCPVITEVETGDVRLMDEGGNSPDRAIVKIYKTERIVPEVPVQRYEP